MISSSGRADVSDADLVAALRVPGDARLAAWSELVGRHSSKMYAVARSFAIDAATAEDLVQTAWLRLIERADQLRDPGALGPWLCAIVRNEARRIVTRRRDIPTELALGERPVASDGPDVPGARLARNEDAQVVRVAFGYLGEECQQLLRLLLVEPPLSYDEIASAVGRPRGSLGPTRRRCLEQLKRHLPEGFER